MSLNKSNEDKDVNKEDRTSDKRKTQNFLLLSSSSSLGRAYFLSLSLSLPLSLCLPRPLVSFKQSEFRTRSQYLSTRRNVYSYPVHTTYDQDFEKLRECIQKFPDWQPGVRTANATAVCH
jgi:hypothetical protein